MIYEDFLPHVLPDVPTCPRVVALHHIKLAAIEFCDRSHAWREELDPVTADGSSEYALNIDDQMEVVRLLEVEVDGEPFDVVTALEGKKAIRCADTSRDIAFTNRRDLTLYPAPTTGDIVATVAVKPSFESEEFPDDVGAHHAEHIACGALARLFRQPKKDWTDLAQASDRQGLFDRHIDSAAAGAASSHGGTLRVQPAPL